MPDKGECGHARKYHTDVGEEKYKQKEKRKDQKKDGGKTKRTL